MSVYLYRYSIAYRYLSYRKISSLKTLHELTCICICIPTPKPE